MTPDLKPRRLGWWALAALGSVAFAATALGGTVALAFATREGDAWAVVRALPSVGAALLFWGWITLGAWHRVQNTSTAYGASITSEVPVEDAPSEPHRWGPVAMVANGIVVLLFMAMIGFALWAAVENNRDDAELKKVRDRVDIAVQRADITRADVARAKAASAAWAWNATGEPGEAPDPKTALLPVDGARVVDMVVDEDHAAILIRPDHGSKCVVVYIDSDDLPTTRITDRCI